MHNGGVVRQPTYVVSERNPRCGFITDPLMELCAGCFHPLSVHHGRRLGARCQEIIEAHGLMCPGCPGFTRDRDWRRRCQEYRDWVSCHHGEDPSGLFDLIPYDRPKSHH